MGGSSATKQGLPKVPGWLSPLLKGEANQYGQFQGQGPSLLSLYQDFPLEGTSQLNQLGRSDISSFQGLAQDPFALTGQEQSAANQFGQFNGQAGQPSAATQAELGLFQSQIAPQIGQQSELMGQGNSGAALQAEAQGMQNAMVPFEQQDLQNQLSAAQGESQLGQAQYQQGVGNISNALSGQEYLQNQYQTALSNFYNQQQGQSQMGLGLQTQPFGLLGQTIGGGTTVNTSPKF